MASVQSRRRVTVTPDPAPLPEVPRWQALDLAIVQGCRRIEAEFLALMAHVDEFVRERYWLQSGYLDARRYFEDRVGISYETIARRLRIYRAIQSAEETARPALQAGLLEVGIRKADALVRLPVTDIPAHLPLAKEATCEAVRVAVSEALGKPDHPDAPGERWWRLTLACFAEPDVREELEAVFAAGARLAETTNKLGVLLAMVREVKVEWLRAAS